MPGGSRSDRDRPEKRFTLLAYSLGASFLLFIMNLDSGRHGNDRRRVGLRVLLYCCVERRHLDIAVQASLSR